MGLPVLPIVYNQYMEYFEQQALAMAQPMQRLWRCYVDDTYTIMKKAHAQEFTEYLNTVDTDVRWMTEGEVETMVTKGMDEEIVCDSVERASVIYPEGLVKTKVVRKETHTNQYLPNLSSNHPLEHKKGVVHTLFQRADAMIVSDPKDREEEKHFVGMVTQVG